MGGPRDCHIKLNKSDKYMILLILESKTKNAN